MTLTNDATQQWSELAQHMEGLLSAWDAGGDAPSLADFLPKDNLALEVVALVELIKIDLEQRRTRGLWQPLEWYAEKFPAILHAGEPPCDLIYEEYQVRKSAGEEVDPHEYFHRFPNSRVALGRLLNCHDVGKSSSLAAGRPSETFEPGDVLDDFDLLTRLGSGAFANVFLARQRSMQRIVALKVSADKGVEGQTLAQLDHPHIVRVYDQRRLPERKLRLLYMQYAPGGSLQDVVFRVRRTTPAERNGRMLIEAVNESLDRAGYSPPESSAHRRRLANASWTETVCRMGIQLAQALDFAHHRGVLHRDVKPANVLLSAECAPKLADFNISFSSEVQGATPAAYFGGSLAYMSPEQLEACNPEHERKADSLDARSDLFSLAAMLWELLYGLRPYSDAGLTSGWISTLIELVHRRRTQRPTPPDSVRQDGLTRSVTEVLQETLSADPADRPASGTELARKLALCLQPRSKQLLEIPRGGVRKFARSWPLLAAAILVAVPNLCGAAFNLSYNETELWGKLLTDPGDNEKWLTIVLILNPIYFGIAAWLIYRVMGAAALAVQRSLSPKSLTADEAIKLRRQSLNFGHAAAALGAVVWLTAGIAFPAAIHIIIGKWPNYAQFFGSMLICGMLAAAYPFFGLTLLVTKVYFPALLPFAPGTDEDDARLTALASQSKYYLAIAGLVPFAGILLIVLQGQTDQRRWVLLVLILFGVAGVGGALWANGRIHAAIRDLLAAVHPLDVTNTNTESVEAF